jgi:hypothetical protein
MLAKEAAAPWWKKMVEWRTPLETERPSPLPPSPPPYLESTNTKADPIDIIEDQDLREEQITVNNINVGNMLNKIDTAMVRNLTQKDNTAFSATMYEIDQILFTKTSQSAVAHSKTRSLQSRHPTKCIPWTKEEDETLVKMKEEDGCSWEEISDALPSRTPGAIQVHYSTKLGGGTGSRKRRRP